MTARVEYGSVVARVARWLISNSDLRISRKLVHLVKKERWRGQRQLQWRWMVTFSVLFGFAEGGASRIMIFFDNRGTEALDGGE